MKITDKELRIKVDMIRTIVNDKIKKLRGPYGESVLSNIDHMVLDAIHLMLENAKNKENISNGYMDGVMDCCLVFIAFGEKWKEIVKREEGIEE